MTGIKQQIQDDVKQAMKAKEKAKLATLRLITAAIKQKEVDERIELDDAQMLILLDKLCKQRRESISQYEQANRPDLVETEQAELEIITQYLPKQLSSEEIESLIGEAISVTGAASIKDMGKVMGMLKPKLQGRADLTAVSQKIKEQLAEA